jgi:eukaryotic-like serine/threonine-protein kinase
MVWLGRLAAVGVLLAAAAAADDPLQTGLKALEEQRYQAAVDSFRAAIAADSNDYSAHFNLAFALSMLGGNNDAAAIAEYQQTLRLKPGLYQAELNLGILLLRQKQGAAAVPHLEAAAKEKPAQFRPAYYLAEALAAAGQTGAAETRFREAVQIDPKSAAAEAGWGRALTGANRLTEAAEHLRKAAALDPTYNDGLLDLASRYEQAKQPAEAIAIYRLFPDNAGAQERMGALLLESGKPDEAVTALEAAVAKAPTAANRYALATAYLRTKQTDKAAAALEMAIQAEPSNLDLRLVHGRLLRDSRKYPEAAQEFYRVVQARPEAKEGWSELAGVLILMEHYPQALAALDKVQTLGGETAGINYLRAIVLDKNKMFKPALAAYQRFLEMSHNQNPDEEFKARQRVRIIEKELSKH